MTEIETKSIDDLLPDPNNVNRHTQRGHGLVENSIRRRGVGRGILAAGKNTEKPVIMAGNLTHEKARDAGINEVVFVHTTGNQLVVNVRDDLDPTSPEAIALGIEDNESGKLSYNPDIDLLAAMSAGDNGVLSKLKEDDKIFGDMLAGMGVKNAEPVDAEPQIDSIGIGRLRPRWSQKGNINFLCIRAWSTNDKELEIEKIKKIKKDMDNDYAEMIALEVYENLKKTFCNLSDMVITSAPANGKEVNFSSLVAGKLAKLAELDFVSIFWQKEHATRSVLGERENIIMNKDVKAKRVIFFDDIATSCRTVTECINLLNKNFVIPVIWIYSDAA